MSAVVEPASVALGTRPSHCTECDYALEGLPAEGNCPECGHGYDSSCLILRGYQSGRDASYATGTRTRMIWSLCGWTVFLLIQLSQLIGSAQSRSATDWLMTAMVFAMMVWSLVSLMWRRSAVEGPPCQLWLCPEGYWLRDRTAVTPKPGASRLQRIIGWLFALAAMGTIIYTAPMAVSLIFIGVGIVPFVLIWRFARAEPPPTVVKAVGDEKRVVFNAWEPRTNASVERVSRGLFRVQIVPDVGSFWKLDLRRPNEFLTEISEDEAVTLQKMLSSWILASAALPVRAS